MINHCLDMLYPRRCPICGEIVLPKGEKACKGCREKLTYVKEPRCKKCSKPIAAEETEYCFDCGRKEYHYTRGMALWVYDENIKKSVGDFKYKNKREYVDFYAEELIKIYGNTLAKINPEAFVPVPVHKSRLRSRGYNQAEVLAGALGKRLEIPVLSNLLLRDKKTVPQKGLDDRQRLKNLQKAFRFNAGAARAGEQKRIVLVDDIYTTGSTIEACSRILLENGIRQVDFISLCIGKGY